jgi:uncharacterized membrane protein YoaK (UPF0700 family)
MEPILTGAWRTLVPGPDNRDGPLPPFMVLLTVVTGFVDSFSYLVLGHVFVANMTGNVVFSGFSLAGSRQFSLLSSVVALLAFVGGAAFGGRIIRSDQEHRGRLLYNVLLVEFILVTASYFIAQFGPNPASGIKYLLIVLLALTMGAQNSAARHLAVPDLTTTVLTMTLTGIGADGRLAGAAGGMPEQRLKLGRRLLSILAMFLGALLGALLILNGHAAIALLCPLVLLAAATFVGERMLTSTGSWTKR